VDTRDQLVEVDTRPVGAVYNDRTRVVQVDPDAACSRLAYEHVELAALEAFLHRSFVLRLARVRVYARISRVE
jgi:hypothetical protein